MKNIQKLIAIFLCVFLISGILPESTKAESDYLKILYASDGERFDASESPKTTFAVQTGHSQKLYLDDERGYVANIGKTASDPVVAGQVSRIDINTANNDSNNHIVFEFDFCVADAPSSKRLYLIKRNSGSSQPELFTFDGTKFYSGNGSYEYTVGKWYTISVETNLAQDYYSVDVIDGEDVTHLSTEVSETLDVPSMRFAEKSASGTDYFDVYIDNIRYYKLIEKPQGYIAPDVSITADKDEYYLGETVNLTVSPEGTSLVSTTVYINDEKVGTYTDEAVDIPYTPSEEGTYTVKAVTKNDYEVEASEEITFTVNPNEAPAVSFVGIDSDVTFEESDDMTLNVEADDDNGISKIELYVDGVLKHTSSQATLSYDFSQLDPDYGTYEVEAKAYDLCNLSASKKISVTLKPDGYVLPTVSISADSYSAICGETVELSVSADGSHFEKVDVYINEELYQSYNEKEFVLPISKEIDGDYAVKVIARDTIGKEVSKNVTVTFNLPEGYSSPTVMVSAAEISKKVGETATATVTVGGTHWSLVEVYINGELYNTYEQSKFNVTFTPDETGTYSVKAVVKDKFNKTNEESVDFYFTSNGLPAVCFEDFTDGANISYSYNDSKNLKVIAEDSDGIEKIELYINEVLVKTQMSDTMQIDFDEFDSGLGKFNVKAVAYDNFGLCKDSSVTINVTNETRNLKYENGEFDSDVTFSVNRGHAYVGTYDEEHGKSVLIGMAPEDGDPKSDTSQVALYKGNYTHTNFVFDICVAEAPDGVGLTLAMRNVLDGAVQLPELFKVNGTKFVSSSGQFSYETGKWYTVSVETNLQAGWYSVKVIDGEAVTTISNGVPYNFGTFSAWRFFTSTNRSDYCEMALDNFKFYEVLSAPKVVSVGYDSLSSADKIPTDAEKINLILDSALAAGDINKDNVKLYNGDSEVSVSQIRYAYAENRIEIIPAQSLAPGSDYTIVLDSSIRISDNKTLGAKIKASFITETAGVDIQNIVWKPKRDNSAELKYSADNLTYNAQNNNFERVPLKCIVTLWDEEGRFVKTYAKEDVLSTASEDYTFTIPDGALYRAEVYFADSLTTPEIYHTAEFEKDFFPVAPTL